MTGHPGASDAFTSADAALRSLADWLDEADRLIDRLAAARGIPRDNAGDDVQQAMRHLADWFTARPDTAREAWDYVCDRLGVPQAPARPEPRLHHLEDPS